jgi:MFS family permease
MEMDSHNAKFPKYMIYCVFVACLGSFSNGWVIGSPNVPGEITHNCPNGNAHIYSRAFPDCLPMDNALWGFAVASFCIGGLVGGLSAGALQTKVGRKRAIMLNNWGYIIGGILIGCSVHEAMFIVGRILCGLGCGMGSLSIPTYIGEVSTIKARGAMGTCNQFFIVVGILLSSVIGLPLATVPLWRLNYAIVAIPAIFQFFLMNTCVETPRYLVSVNRIEDARSSLQKLRDRANIDKEFYGMVEGYFGTAAAQSMTNYQDSAISAEEKKEAAGETTAAVPRAEDVPTEGGNHETDHLTTSVTEQQDTGGFDNSAEGDLVPAPHSGAGDQNTMNVIEIFKDPVIRRIALTVICSHAFQQLVGINAVMYYSTTIFTVAFNPEFSKYMTIVTTVVNFIMTLVSVVAIDRMGRRPLLLISNAGACLFSVLLVIGYVYQISGLLVASVFLYVASFAIGIGPIPWLMTSEITPTYV